MHQSVPGPTKEVNSKDLINVDEVFRKKGKKVYPFIPKFLIRKLENLVHQEDINSALNRLGHLRGLEFVDAILSQDFKPDIQVVNPENIPGQGRFIIASNHPLGGLDGMVLMSVVGKKRKDFKFLANDILLELPAVKELFVPVNKHGRNSQEAVKLFHDLYESEQLVLVFPAGLVSRKQKHGISDLEWKKSFITKAIKYKRDIIPVHIDGYNSSLFYRMANWRKRLGIKSNLEMLLLPREMFMQHNRKITLTFGSPISYKTFSRDKSHYQWAQKIKQHVYQLAHEGEKMGQ